jgi:hypothetical protein
LHKRVISDSKRWPASHELLPIKSFRCCGLIPSKPAVEPFGKDIMALKTLSSETDK